MGPTGRRRTRTVIENEKEKHTIKLSGLDHKIYTYTFCFRVDKFVFQSNGNDIVQIGCDSSNSFISPSFFCSLVPFLRAFESVHADGCVICIRNARAINICWFVHSVSFLFIEVWRAMEQYFCRCCFVSKSTIIFIISKNFTHNLPFLPRLSSFIFELLIYNILLFIWLACMTCARMDDIVVRILTRSEVWFIFVSIWAENQDDPFDWGKCNIHRKMPKNVRSKTY